MSFMAQFTVFMFQNCWKPASNFFAELEGKYFTPSLKWSGFELTGLLRYVFLLCCYETDNAQLNIHTLLEM